MLVKIKRPVSLNELKNRKCEFDTTDAMDYIDQFGSDADFIGSLKETTTPGIYTFSVDEIINKDLKTLNVSDPKGLMLLKKALIYDFGFKEDEFEIIS